MYITTTIKIVKVSFTPKSSWCPFIIFFLANPTSVPKQLLICFLLLQINLHFIKVCIHIHWILQYILYFLGLFFTSVIILRFIHVVACINNLFLLLNSILLYGYTKICSFIHLYQQDIWFVSVWDYKQSCYEHLCASLCVDICFDFCLLGKYLQMQRLICMAGLVLNKLLIVFKVIL